MIFMKFLVALLTSIVTVSVHILRNHFRGPWEGNDYLDNAGGGGGVQNWAKVDYVICALSLILQGV